MHVKAFIIPGFIKSLTQMKFSINNCFIFFSTEYEEDLTVMGFPPVEERSGPEGAEEEDESAPVSSSVRNSGSSAAPGHDPDAQKNVEERNTNPDDEDKDDNDEEQCK